MDTRLAGQMGGLQTLRAQGVKHFKRISKIAAEKRTQKAKEKKASNA